MKISRVKKTLQQIFSASWKNISPVVRYPGLTKFLQRFCLGLLAIIFTGGLYTGSFPFLTQISRVAAVSPRIAARTVSSQKERDSIAVLVQAGKEHYQVGQFTEAIAQWQQASQMYASRGDGVNQAAMLNNLALGYQQLGKLTEAKKAITQSINLLSAIDNPTSEIQNLLAGALNVQGSLLLSGGKVEDALTTWERAADIYNKAGNKIGLVRILLNQTQALRELGLHKRGKNILESVNQTLQNQPDSLLKVSSLLNFGDALRLMGELTQSVEVLQQGLAIAQKLQSPSDISLAYLSLGNTAVSAQKTHSALKYYQQAITKSPSPSIKLQAQLNQLRLLMETEKFDSAKKLIADIQPALKSLPASRTTVYAQVNFGQYLMKLGGDAQTTAKILAGAVKQAETIGDDRAQSYALGYLGELYEQQQQLSQGQKLTEKALILAQGSNASDIAYRWQWQLGRILKATGNLKQAIAAYDEAVKTLGYIRNDLAASNMDIQFSFRESVEPVYREFVSLLLTPDQKKDAGKDEEKNLKKAREVIESLQLAELDNFFREPCLVGTPTQIDKIDSQAAVIYPIILSDRLEVVLSIPNQPLRHYATAISLKELEVIIEKMQRALRRSFLKNHHLPIVKKVYDLLIRPLEADLQASNIKTLTFVLDGSLKNLPMAALYDGEQYLVEKYNIALTPGLQLLAPQPLKNQKLKLLVGGLSEERQGFMAIPSVKTEIQQIKSEISSQVLFNQKFTTKELEKQIAKTPYPVVHLATHGEFSSQAEDTFILTWDDRLNVKELGKILQTREEDKQTAIELLVLSACKTAAGDKRAPLGLAGVAVRSGARSTIASLWSVDDKSTSQLMVEFYKQLTDSKISKAEALRRAQLQLLKQPESNHPFFWAPFVLVGNWL